MVFLDLTVPKAPHAEIKRLNYSAISIHPMLAQPEDVNLIGYKFFISKEQGVENTEPVLLPLNTTVYIVTGLGELVSHVFISSNIDVPDSIKLFSSKYCVANLFGKQQIIGSTVKI